MKNIVLLLAFILLTRPFWPLAEYAINYEYIVNTLCENKEQPEKECNGTCYLSKQLAKETEKDKNPSSNKTSKAEIPQFTITDLIPAIQFAPEEYPIATKLAVYRSNLFPSLFISEILDPPRVG